MRISINAYLPVFGLKRLRIITMDDQHESITTYKGLTLFLRKSIYHLLRITFTVVY